MCVTSLIMPLNQSKSHYQAPNQGLESHLLPVVEQSFITKGMSAGRSAHLSCNVTLFSSFINKNPEKRLLLFSNVFEIRLWV